MTSQETIKEERDRELKIIKEELRITKRRRARLGEQVLTEK